MRSARIFIMALPVMVIISLSSCNDNDRKADNDQMRNDSIRMAEENRLEQERMDFENTSVFALVQEDTSLTSFSGNLESNELSQNFRQNEGPYTIFAPSNTAYGSLSEDVRKTFEDPIKRQENSARMHYLIVDEELTAADLLSQIRGNNGTYTLTTMQGEDLTATLEGETVMLTDGSGNKARIIETDRDASNGVIHVIDAVLMPKDVTTNAAGNTTGNNQTNRTASDTSSTNRGM